MANSPKGRMHPVAAGVVGAVVGAAAGAAAIALSDEKTRKMLQDKVTELRIRGTKK